MITITWDLVITIAITSSITSAFNAVVTFIVYRFIIKNFEIFTKGKQAQAQTQATPVNCPLVNKVPDG